MGSGVGGMHISAYQSLPDQYQVLAVCDISKDRAAALAADFSIARCVSSIATLCAMDDLDVIDICTPSFLHFAQVRQVLEAGKHAVCEKPVAASLREVDQLIELEHSAGKRVMPIFQYRFGHGLQKLKLLIDSGIAGRAYLSTFETAWRRRSDYYDVPWRGKWHSELGGAMVTLAIHAQDALLHLIGPPRRVFAHTATLVNRIETEDCVTASLEMADGSLASLSITTGSAEEISRYRFCFSNLTAESNHTPYSNTLDPWRFTADNAETRDRMEEALAHFTPLPEGYAGQFARFHEALRTGSELPVTLEEARASLALITAMYHSAGTGRSVDLPLQADHPMYDGWQVSP